MSIGKRICDRRKTLGLTLPRLAELADVGKGYLSGVEHGDMMPGANNLLALGRVLGVSTDWLLGRPLVVEKPAGAPRLPVLKIETADGLIATSACPRCGWSDPHRHEVRQCERCGGHGEVVEKLNAGTNYVPCARCLAAGVVERVVVDPVASPEFDPRLCVLVNSNPWAEEGAGKGATAKPADPRFRRNDLLRATPAELAIRFAIDAVEGLPADTRLTDAVVKLQEALDRVADFVDGVDRRPSVVIPDLNIHGGLDEEGRWVGPALGGIERMKAPVPQVVNFVEWVADQPCQRTMGGKSCREREGDAPEWCCPPCRAAIIRYGPLPRAGEGDNP